MPRTRSIMRAKPSPSMAVALLALFVALGGSAWAVSKNSIGPKELKNNAVRAKHVKKNQVRKKHIKKNHVRKRHIKNDHVLGRHVRDGSLAAQDFSDSALQQLQGPPGPKGDRGPQGERGPAGSTSCPEGTTRLGDTAICYETAKSSATGPLDALADCSFRERSLPDPAEAAAISRTTDESRIWSNVIYRSDTDGLVGVSVLSGDGFVSLGEANTSAEYRCIAYASDQ